MPSVSLISPMVAMAPHVRSPKHQATFTSTITMARNNHFISPTRQPLLDHPQAVLLDDYVGGALRWCNPTRARFNLHSSKTRASDGASDPPSTSNGDSSSDPLANAQVEWRTRDSRKGETCPAELAIRLHHDPNQVKAVTFSAFRCRRPKHPTRRGYRRTSALSSKTSGACAPCLLGGTSRGGSECFSLWALPSLSSRAYSTGYQL